MSTVQSKSYNPTLTDINDPRFTELVNHPDRWFMNCLIGDNDAYYGRGYEKLEAIHRLKDGSVSPGDFVVIGNRAGVVVEVITGNAKSDGEIKGIVVNEDMRYLPKDYRNDPASFGYDDDASKRNRTITYVFGKDTVLEGNRNGGGAVMLFQGSLMIMKQYTSDKSTWNQVAQSADKYNSDAVVVVEP